MQHSRQFLLDSYRSMATIRRFEDRVHDEFVAGKIPGFVHLYAGEEASAVGVCSQLGTRVKYDAAVFASLRYMSVLWIPALPCAFFGRNADGKASTRFQDLRDLVDHLQVASYDRERSR